MPSYQNQSCPAWIPSWLQDEQLRANTDINMRQGCQAFLLILVDSWAQVRSQVFFNKSSVSTCYKFCIWLHLCDKTPEIKNLKEQRFILVQAFRGFRLCWASSLLLGLWQGRNIMVEGTGRGTAYLEARK
jgi:hypothetical protein